MAGPKASKIELTSGSWHVQKNKYVKTIFAAFGALLLLPACNDSPAALSGSTTFFVSDASNDIPTCKTISADKKMQPGIDGSTWHWAKTDDAYGLLFCQQHKSGSVSAWREVSKNGKATHSLKFSQSNTLFRPI